MYLELNEFIGSQLTIANLAIISEASSNDGRLCALLDEISQFFSNNSKKLSELIVQMGKPLYYQVNTLDKCCSSDNTDIANYFLNLLNKISFKFKELANKIKSESDLVADILLDSATQVNDLELKCIDYLREVESENMEINKMSNLRQLMADKGIEAKKMMKRGSLKNPNAYLSVLLRDNHVYNASEKEDYAFIFSMNFSDEWSDKVETGWVPPEGLFTKSAKEIADTLISESKDKKQAMSRLNFYINRAGKNLTSERQKELEKAKQIIHEENS